MNFKRLPEVVVLGSGTSTGVPMLGVDYPDSFLANRKNHRTRPSILLRGPEGDVLVDCTPEMRLQLLPYQVRKLDAVIVTHGHADHIMGMDDLRSFSIHQNGPVRVYANAATQADIRRVFPYAFRDGPENIMLPKFDLRDVVDPLAAGGMTLRLFRLIHGNIDSLGVRVNNFAYLTDVSEIPMPSWDYLDDLEVLILDAVRYRPHPNHFHFERALEIAERIGARRTYLTHLSHDFDHDIVEAGLPEGIRLAYDGLRIPL